MTSDVVSIISGDLDGAELRREKRKNSRHLRCDGRADNEEIQTAIDSAGKNGTVMSVPAHVWERIFGKR